MQRFLDGEVAVLCNKSQLVEFMNLCEKCGLVWGSGDKPTDYSKFLSIGKIDRTIIFNRCYHLMYDTVCDRKYYPCHVISFEELEIDIRNQSDPVPLDLIQLYSE